MNSDSTKQIIGKYSDAEKKHVKDFVNSDFYSFVKDNLLTGATGTELKDGKYHLDWMNQVAVRNISVPLQNGGRVDKEQFAEEAMATHQALQIIEEIFARYEIVANFKEEEKTVKKKPSLK